jgi:N-hydroxyarylamine O-acetyltransferase
MSEFEVPVERYLDRIGYSGSAEPTFDTLCKLQHAHLTSVPFENIDVVNRVEIRTDLAWSIAKVVDRHRGGWCFELNGAFGALLEALGFDVLRLGAAVLLDGPNRLIDHLTLEVMLDEPYLVDVGFGENFVEPLRLNHPGPQVDPAGVFEFIESSEGTTLTHHDDQGVPGPLFRFRRVARELADFDPASELLRTDPGRHWMHKPFATRLLGSGADRVTLLKDRLKVTSGNETTEMPVAADEWDGVLLDRFRLENLLA